MRSRAEALYDLISPEYWVAFGLYANETHREYLQKFLERVAPHSTPACLPVPRSGITRSLRGVLPAPSGMRAGGCPNHAYNKSMIIKEIQSKTILSVSKVYPYVINPYTGCQHNCLYCYAHFMKRFTGHKEPWGQFVDVKVNAPDLLRLEITREKTDRVWISGVCDPYQPLEAKYKLTRQCLEILAQNDWPVIVQTRSPLVLRDMDILRKGRNFEVGFSITTVDDDIRRLFEPNAPPIKERVRALDELHRAGIRTFAMIAPILPRAENLAEILAGKIDYVMVDRMNYHYADWVYRKYGLEDKMTDDYFYRTERNLSSAFAKLGLRC